ncbi:unnamed protein product [Ascophyllum nodosum]
MSIEMLRGQVVAVCLLSSFLTSQAFFVTPAAARTGLTASGQGKAASPSRCNRHGIWFGGRDSNRDRSARRRAGSALQMDHLEEVPEEMSNKVLELECPDTGEVLECCAERFAMVQGQRYLAAYPKDPAVAVAFDVNGEVAPVPIDDPLMDELFPLAQACLNDLGPGITLLRTPASLTARGLDDVVGSIDEEDDEADFSGPLEGDDSVEDEAGEGGQEGLSEDDDEDDDDDDDDEFYDDADEVELLGEFVAEGEEFLLVRFLEPLLLLAKEKEPGRFVLLNDEEDEDASPAVEALLSEEGL